MKNNKDIKKNIDVKSQEDINKKDNKSQEAVFYLKLNNIVFNICQLKE